MDRIVITFIWAVASLGVFLGNATFGTEPEPADEVIVLSLPSTLAPEPRFTTTTTVAIQFRHGDCSWLPAMARRAGWDEEHIPKLTEVVMRESGCCPNRRGGDAVDANCNITHVTEWNHRSDTGLLQVNGVNYDVSRNEWAILCREADICAQEPLLDPLTNLRAGKVLFDYYESRGGTGWRPWDPCLWGDDYNHLCKKVSKKQP